MQRIMCKSKIHRATVTAGDLNYIGSLTIDENLMKEADILPYEKIEVWNLNNGARLETYALKGKKGSGVICANGAAARLLHPQDKIIIAAYGQYDEEEIKRFQHKVVLVDEKNQLIPDEE